MGLEDRHENTRNVTGSVCSQRQKTAWISMKWLTTELLLLARPVNHRRIYVWWIEWFKEQDFVAGRLRRANQHNKRHESLAFLIIRVFTLSEMGIEDGLVWDRSRDLSRCKWIQTFAWTCLLCACPRVVDTHVWECLWVMPDNIVCLSCCDSSHAIWMGPGLVLFSHALSELSVWFELMQGIWMCIVCMLMFLSFSSCMSLTLGL